MAKRDNRFQALAKKARQRSTKAEDARMEHLTMLRLAGKIHLARLKPLKLNLNDPTKGLQTLTYEPDILVIENDGETVFEEVKACKKDGTVIYMGDARTKVLTAARAFPFWTFRVVWKHDGVWKYDNL